MELKKNPKADLESRKGIFVLIGLIISLSLSILAYESKSYDNLDVGFGDNKMDDLDEEEIDITRPEPPPPPKEEPPPPPEVPEEIEIKENEEELENELEVDDAETDQDDMMEMPEEEFEEAFISVEKMPMLGDCKNEDCTQSEIMKFIARNFKYPEIAKANGVEGRVILEFVVEKNGKIGRVKILKGLDKHVDKAAIEVVEKLNDKKSPKFSPGRQIGKAVPVKYTVPIKCTLG
ncbi:MAG: energy transducer TonB [Flavobacteriales bacterium]|nr:energy transducer TonB [Flavobacteriales bacterium]MDG1719451.1 energy transducer TonB [Flavobacteriales bacterium]|tara:strand:+ start:976 stop:1677 length:702 start_codon:yes stop_codon:yes gene_type:complete